MFFRSCLVLTFALLQTFTLSMWAEESEEALSVIAEHMHGHLDHISEIKHAVIAGDLEATRKPAIWLATHDAPEGLTGAWLPYVEEMRRYAARAAEAEDLVAAAGAISEIARTCGDCHRASGFSIAFGFDERPPSDQQSLMTQMQRHLWAADRMWEGLIGPSDVAWNRGAHILSEVNLVSSDIAESGTAGASAAENQEQISALLGRARGMGEMGSQAVSVELRSGLYGEFLSSCASCHKLTGGGPAR
jgi:mono/diheme cytochrome c family protein